MYPAHAASASPAFDSATAAPVRRSAASPQRERRAAPGRRETIEGSAKRCGDDVVMAYEGFPRGHAGPVVTEAFVAALYAQEAARANLRDYGYVPGSLLRDEA